MKKIVAWSGGKDSTAMLLRMIESGYKFDEIWWANTGLEYPEMYNYIKKVKEYIKLPVRTIMPKTSFRHWFYGKWTSGMNKGKVRGFPKITTHAYCCRELKINPMNKVYGSKYVKYIGIAYDERYRIQKDDLCKYPLIEWKWTEWKCGEYLKSKGLMNPLYKHMNRTGCWLCPKQSMGSLRFVYENHPKMWEYMKKLEKDSPEGFHHQRTLSKLEDKWKGQTKLECYI